MQNIIGSIILLTFISGHSIRAQGTGDLEAALAEIATSLSQQMKESQISKVAIVPFPDLNGYQSALGEFLAEELITQLFMQNPGKFTVVERRQLNKVLAEQKLSTSSVFEADNISKLGKILGVDAIVTGSIADLGTEIKINARVIAVSTANVFAAAAAKSTRKGTAETLMMQNAPPPQGGALSAASPVQRPDAYFSNSFLRVGIGQVSRSTESRQIMLALNLKNLTNSDLLLALPFSNFEYPIGMMDNLGNRYKARCSEISGVSCVWDSRLMDPENYVTLSANGETTAVFKFMSENTEITGSLFSFSATFARFDNKTVIKFAVGIDNIQVTP